MKTLLGTPDPDPQPRPGGQLVVFRPRPDAPSHELHRPPEWARQLEGRGLLPSKAKLKALARYYGRIVPLWLALAIPRLIKRTAQELVPIARGLARVIGWWASWVTAAGEHETAEIARTVTASGNSDRPHPKVIDTHHRRDSARSWRRKITAVVLIVAAGGVFWLIGHSLWWTALAGFIVIGLLDIIGNWGMAPKDAPPAKRMVLTEAMPVRQLLAEILLTLADNGVEATPDSPMIWDADRKQYRVGLATYDKIAPEHVRAVERRIGAADYAIRLLGTETATSRDMIIAYGNPLVGVPKAPDHAPLSLSITDPLLLGASVVEMPFAIEFAGVQACIIAAPGGGKTEGFFRAMINEVTATHNAVMWWIDLQGGPEGPLWGDVLQKAAYTTAQAEALLDEALAECYRRMDVLAGIARSAHRGEIDPADITSKWRQDLGPALIIGWDEFPMAAAYDGKKLDERGQKPDLLGKAELLARLGRKVWISIVRGMQKTGNSDSGSTVLKNMTTVWIVGPCSMDDTVAVFGTRKRDAGWAPQNFKPATPYAVNDAGMCYIDAAGFGADAYRSWAPLDEGEVVRRSIARVAAGLPQLTEPGPAADTLDAEVVPPGLAAVEAALAHWPKAARLASAVVVEHANERGGTWTQDSLADALKAECGLVTKTGRCPVSKTVLRCYHRVEVQAALGRLGGAE